MLIGYARVSTNDQDAAMQLQQLRRAGVLKVFHEKQSSVGSRPQLQRALDSLRPGDVLAVYKLDRVARSLRDLLNILERIEAVGAGIRSLSEPIDTSSAAGRLMIQVLGAVAEFERSLIRERSMAGQRAAMERGVHCGKRRSIDAETEEDILLFWDTGDYTLRSLAHVFGVSESVVKRTIYRVHKPGHSSLR
ncbi:recombinase family protein [Variovorax sp. VNK109]|uniref:recombinase family protein n=1 Tax=Variovorax sp. VNK109 TaxID=3400919 RepID=UPI003C006F83